jgi:hypothetical protein
VASLVDRRVNFASIYRLSDAELDRLLVVECQHIEALRRPPANATLFRDCLLLDLDIPSRLLCAAGERGKISMQAQWTNLEAAENDLKRLMAGVTRVPVGLLVTAAVAASSGALTGWLVALVVDWLGFLTGLIE